MATRRMYAEPILEKPVAIEFAMPEKLKTYASPKMKKPTSSAPHICRNVLAKTRGRSSPHLGRTVTASMPRIRIHEARIEVPATNGAHMKATEPALPVIEEV